MDIEGILTLDLYDADKIVFNFGCLPLEEDPDPADPEHLPRSRNQFQKFQKECDRVSAADWIPVLP